MALNATMPTVGCQDPIKPDFKALRYRYVSEGNTKCTQQAREQVECEYKSEADGKTLSENTLSSQ